MDQKKHDDSKPCPNCGYCPTCGRANTAPYVPYVPYVPSGPPHNPYPWTPTTITFGTGTHTAPNTSGFIVDDTGALNTKPYGTYAFTQTQEEKHG